MSLKLRLKRRNFFNIFKRRISQWLSLTLIIFVWTNLIIKLEGSSQCAKCIKADRNI